jgi:hypothetical protein
MAVVACMTDVGLSLVVGSINGNTSFQTNSFRQSANAVSASLETLKSAIVIDSDEALMTKARVPLRYRGIRMRGLIQRKQSLRYIH